MMKTTFDREQQEHWAATTNLRAYDHPVVQAFADQRMRFLRKLLGDWRPALALDVGCGDGFGMHYMQPLVERIYGCDYSPAMLQANPAGPRRLVRVDALSLPFAAASFDLVYCWELLHHVSDPQRVVCQMKQLSRRAVLLCEPNCLNPAMAAFAMLTPEERGVLRFTPAYTKRLLVQAGLRDVRLFSVGCFTPNRTPAWMVRFFTHAMPYRWPLVGMYNIALGYV